MIVADTNVVVQLVIETPDSPAARALLNKHIDWRLPPFWRVEFLNVLATQLNTGRLNLEQCELALKETAEMQHLHEVQVPEKLVMATVKRYKTSAYDAVFLSLATHLGTILVTLDGRLAKAAPNLAVNLRDQLKLDL